MLIQTREHFDELKTRLAKSSKVVWDVETRLTDNFTRRDLLGTAFYMPVGVKDYAAYYMPVGHQHDARMFPEVNVPKEWLAELAEYFADPDKVWIAHNAKFDAQINKDNGIPVKSYVCTQVMTHLVDDNRFSYDLDRLGADWFGERKEDLKELTKILGWEQIPPSVMGKYAEQDVALTWRVYEKVLPMIHQQDLVPVFVEAMKMVETLRWVIEEGLLLDVDRSVELSRQATTQMEQIEHRLGFAPTKPSELGRILHGPQPQGHALPVLYWTSPKPPAQPKPALDSQHLREYAFQYPEVKDLVDQVLEFRSLQKANSTWYEGFLAFLDDRNRIHPGFKQHGTETGRLSCAKPNTQQIPRDTVKTPVKKLFLAPPGYQLIECDYSQVELRIACVYAQEEAMMEAYRKGEDLHHLTATRIKSYDFFDNPSEGRQIGKTGNFLWIYMGGARQLQATLWNAAGMRIDLDQCIAWTEEFHRQYPGFREISQKAKKQARKNGYVKLWNGRRRRFVRRRGMDDKQWERILGSAFNAVVQGGAGQCMMVAMNRLYDKYHSGELSSRPVNNVHDSLWFYVPEDRVEQELEIIKSTMAGVPEEIFELPFVVDSKRLA